MLIVCSLYAACCSLHLTASTGCADNWQQDGSVWILLQIQEYLEGPVGLALYEWQDGKIGNCCVQGGKSSASQSPYTCININSSTSWVLMKCFLKALCCLHV